MNKKENIDNDSKNIEMESLDLLHGISVISWNINCLEDCSVNELAKIIAYKNSDIVFLHEFPSFFLQKFLTNLNIESSDEYTVYAQQSEFEYDYKITIVFVKSYLEKNGSITSLKESKFTKDLPFKLRWTEVKVILNDKSLSILGVHCPIYTKDSKNISRNKKIDIFWTILQQYAESEKLLIIGDLNSNLKKRNSFSNIIKELISFGYLDLGSIINENTFKAETRIDYILAHNSLQEEIKKFEVIKLDDADEYKYSDHKIISVEMGK